MSEAIPRPLVATAWCPECEDEVWVDEVTTIQPPEPIDFDDLCRFGPQIARYRLVHLAPRPALEMVRHVWESEQWTVRSAAGGG